MSIECVKLRNYSLSKSTFEAIKKASENQEFDIEWFENISDCSNIPLGVVIELYESFAGLT